MRVFVVLSLVAMAGCECGSPQGYIIDAGLIGDGDPIVNDGGPVDTRDAGPVVCDDDTLEDNDTRTDAVVLQSGTAASAVFCGGDDDWFSLNVAVGCSIAVALRFGASPDAGDLDVLLFAPDGALAGSAQTTGPQENLNVVATRAGAYAARVRGGDRDALDYTITLTNTCSSDLSCPADDIYENNDTAIDATAIDTAVSVDAIACPSDVDVFGVPVTVGCIADSVVTFVDVDGDIDLELLRADGTVLGSSRGVTDQERIVKVVSEVNMTQRVSLFGNDPSGNSYRIRTREVCDSALSCPSDDPFEPNDDSGAATRLESGGDGALGVLCGVNEDLYELLPVSGCSYTATLTFDVALGDLDLELLATDGTTRLGISNGTTASETVTYAATSSARVVWRPFVYQAVDGSAGKYRMTLTSTCQ